MNIRFKIKIQDLQFIIITVVIKSSNLKLLKYWIYKTFKSDSDPNIIPAIKKLLNPISNCKRDVPPQDLDAQHGQVPHILLMPQL